MSGKASRPQTPPDVARQLRSESGFGCCRCGNPFVEYHHIIPWETEHHFRPEDMVALCPYCHAMATAGAMSEKYQRKYKSNPHNIRHGYAKGTLFVEQDVCAVVLAGNLFVVNGPLIRIDDMDMISLGLTAEGALTVSAVIFDENDQLLLEIRENEWITGENLPWDIQYKFNYIKARQKLRNILLEIDAKSQNEPVKMRASLYRHGHQAQMTPAQMVVGHTQMNMIIRNSRFVNAYIEADTKRDNIRIMAGGSPIG